MNKKIKALVQKYEKDMQFENRFEDLKDKLDLIPDQNNANEVYVIRRKLMPAYVMTIVLLMLVTGIIGLQLGLNSNYFTGPERVDLVEDKLSDMMDIYDRESVSSLLIESDSKILVYIGLKGNDKVIVLRGQALNTNDVFHIEYSGQNYELSRGNDYTLVQIVDESDVQLIVTVKRGNIERSTSTFVLDLTREFDFLGF